MSAPQPLSQATERLRSFLLSVPKIDRFGKDRAFLLGDAVFPAFEALRLEYAGDTYAQRFLDRNQEFIGLFRNRGQKAALAYFHDLARRADELGSDDPEISVKGFESAIAFLELKWKPVAWITTLVSWAEEVKKLPGGPAAHGEQVIELLTLAVESARLRKVNWELAMAAHDLAVAYAQRMAGDPIENSELALQLAEESIRHYETIEFRGPIGDPSRTEGNTRMTLGNLWRDRAAGEKQDNLARALESYRSAQRVVSRQKHRQLYAQLMNNQGLALLDLNAGDPGQNREDAIDCFRQALEFFTEARTPFDWGRLQVNLSLAMLHRARGDRAENIEAAIQHAQAALRVFPRQRFPRQWAAAQNNLGLSYLQRLRGSKADNVETAIGHMERALEVRTRESEPMQWAKMQWNLSFAFAERTRGRPSENIERGIRAGRHALEVYTPDRNPLEWAKVHVNLANLLIARIEGEIADNLEQALDHLNRAASVLTVERSAEDWAGLHHLFGMIYTRRRHGDPSANIERALGHYQQALQVRTPERFRDQWAATQNNLGLLYTHRQIGVRSENLRLATEHFENALQVYSRKDARNWASTHRNLANIWSYRRDGNRDENLRQAIAHLQTALEALSAQDDPIEWAGVQNNLGQSWAELAGLDADTRRREATRCFEAALSTYRSTGLVSAARQTYRNLANLEFRAGAWQAAYDHYQHGIESGRSLLDASYTEAGMLSEIGEISYLYGRAAYCLVKLERWGEALVLLERGKTRFLLEALGLCEDLPAEIPDGLRARVMDARQELKELNARLRLRDGIAQPLPAESGPAIRAARSRLDQLMEEVESISQEPISAELSLPAICALARPGEVLVAPIVTTQGCAVFMLTSGLTDISAAHVLEIDGFDVQAFLTGPNDQGWLDAYMRRAAEPRIWMETVERLTGHLWQKLMGPIREFALAPGIAPGSPMIIVPQGGLGLLPLHAAWDDSQGPRRYFLDDFVVSYAPGFQVLKTSRERALARPAGRSALAVVNPTEDLPRSEDEGDVVAEVFGANSATVLRRGEAVKGVVSRLMAERSHLHFACHGVYDWQNPLGSGFLLAQEETLSMAEILQWQLPATRLAVLSACETGITDIRQAPDEYFGIPLAFLHAGAPAVVSTLWAVPDHSTALLMGRFYREQMTSGDPAAALRQAQLGLRDASVAEISEHYLSYLRMSAESALTAWMDLPMTGPESRPYAHPYFWAAFIMIGS